MIVKLPNESEPRTLHFAAGTLLGGLNSKEFKEDLQKPYTTQSDGNWQVRERAVFALLATGGPLVIEPLTKALRDADPDVRVQAALALGKIADLSVLPELEQMAQHDKGITRHHWEPATMFARMAIDEIRLRHSGSAIP